MIKQSIIIRSIKNIFRNKINYLNIFLLSIAIAITSFSFTYMKSLNNLWNEWTNKFYEFRVAYVSYDFDNISLEDALKVLKTKPHIEEVFTSDSYRIGADAVDYHNESNDGQISILGVMNDGIKIYKGDNLEKYDGENVLICPKEFNPNSRVYFIEYDKIKPYNFENMIGEEINLNIAMKEEIKFKIVGLYNQEDYFLAGNTCYTSFNTVKKLNLIYQPEVFQKDENNQSGSSFPIFAVFDSAQNLIDMSDILEKDGFFVTPTFQIKKNVGNNIIKILSILTIIFFIISTVIIVFTTLKRTEERKKEFSINKAIGYTQYDINKLLYGESIILGLIAFILVIIFSFLVFFIYKFYYLSNNVELSHISICFSLKGMALSILISILIPLVANFFASKKIEKYNIINSLRD